MLMAVGCGWLWRAHQMHARDAHLGPIQLEMRQAIGKRRQGQPRAPADRFLLIIETEIERIKSEGVSPEELAKAKSQRRLIRILTGPDGDYTSLQTALGRALALGEFALFDGDPGLINTEQSRYEAITPQKIRETAQKYFVTGNTAVLFIRPIESKSETGRR